MNNKKKLSKKLFSLMLVMMMVLVSIPTAIFAAESEYQTVLIGSTNITTEATWSSTKNEGTISWDAKSATLTLNNADLSQWSSYGNTYGVVVEPQDQTRTVTIKLIGTNTIGTEAKPCVGSAFAIKANTVVEAEANAKLNIYDSSVEGEQGNALYVKGNLCIKGGIMDLTAAYPAFYSTEAITIEGGDIKASVMSDGSAIYGYKGITIKGAKTKITTESLYCTLICRENDIVISDGAVVNGTTTNDSLIYNPSGNIRLSDATVTLKSDFGGSTGLFVNNDVGNIIIENSNLTIDTDSTGIYTKNMDVRITDSILNLTSAKGNSINSWGKLIIEGDKTKITANSNSPMYSWDVLSINGGNVSSTASNGTAISSSKGIAITGGTVNAKTAAAMSAIYAKTGDINIEGANTVVKAESAQDSAIFARDGQIHLNSPQIEATAAEGFAAIVARQYSQSDSEAIVPNITIDDKYLTVYGSADLASTKWAETKNTSGNQKFYSDTVFVTKGTASPIADLTKALQKVSIVYLDADYTLVDKAIAAANALNANDYVDFSKVTAAINAVVKGKNITEQETVNAYATAIDDAIKALKKKAVVTPETPDTDKPNVNDPNAPQTSDSTHALIWFTLISVSACALIIRVYRKKNTF